MDILLNGATGRMGKEVEKYIENQEDIKIKCGFGIEEILDKNFPIYNDINKIKEKVDVIIDFSTPKATFKILEYAKQTKTPIVIATTGFSKDELKKIENLSKEIPIFISSNMSVDINLMAQIVQKIAKVLSSADIEIIETHHNKKIDAPSGTAILLADAINEVFNKEKTYTFDRMQKREQRNKKEIGFSSIRGGNIVGEHTVEFFGENVSLEITHKAYSRQVFAEGAVKAAKFLLNKNQGLYNMKDLT